MEEGLHAGAREQARKRRKGGDLQGAMARVPQAAAGQVVLHLPFVFRHLLAEKRKLVPWSVMVLLWMMCWLMCGRGWRPSCWYEWLAASDVLGTYRREVAPLAWANGASTRSWQSLGVDSGIVRYSLQHNVSVLELWSLVLFCWILPFCSLLLWEKSHSILVS